MEEAYLEFRAGRVRVLGGHTWLRWGPGREGTLALSDAAPALDLLRAEVGLFQTWRLQWFGSVLDPGAQPLENAARCDRIALLFGGEAQGLPPEIVQACDRRVTIPMKLGTDSLNVAVAAGICLYHFAL